MAALWKAIAHANEPVRMKTSITCTKNWLPYSPMATKNGPAGFCASSMSDDSG